MEQIVLGRPACTGDALVELEMGQWGWGWFKESLCSH